MMTKKDYERAATIAKEYHAIAGGHGDGRQRVADSVTEAFVALFRGDNPRFDPDRFREACRVEIKDGKEVKRGR